MAGQLLGQGKMNLKFETFPLANPASVTSLKLVSSGGVRLLLSTYARWRGTELVSAPVGQAGGAPDTVMTVGGVPGQPSWDAAVLQDGSITAVWTVAGSAIMGLEHRNSRGAEAAPVNTGDDAFGVFGSPHFVKGGPPAQLPLSSIEVSGRRPRLVLFSKQPAGEYGKCRELAVRWSAYPQDARILAWQGGYLLLLNALVPGLTGGAAKVQRTTGSGGAVGEGIVECTKLKPDFEAAGPATRLLGGQPVYEFDAAAATDRIAVIATTRKGFIAGLGVLPAGVLPRNSWAETPWPAPLTTPSVLVAGPRVYFAAIESAGTPQARVLVAHFDLTPGK
jgi:hypothetical protein